MKIAPLKVSDPWYSRLVTNDTVQADTLTGVPIESTVEIELVEMLHTGPENNYRPYLHLRGELTDARPAVELPYGVSALSMSRGSGVTVDAFYDFSQEQLATLVGKGYFTEAFRVPDEMAGIPWTLPGRADFLIVAPEFTDQPPLVFMNVHDHTALEFDEKSSGYELTAYFPDVSAEAEVTADIDPALKHDGSGRDVFHNIDFEEHVALPSEPDEAIEAARATVPDGVFSRLVSEIQAQHDEVDQVVEQDGHEEPAAPGSAWDLYLSRVSPGVEEALSHQAETTENAEVGSDSLEQDAHDEPETETDEVTAEDMEAVTLPGGLLDLAALPEDVELTPLGEQGEGGHDHRKAIDRRAARLRAEINADDGFEQGEADEPTL